MGCTGSRCRRDDGIVVGQQDVAIDAVRPVAFRAGRPWWARASPARRGDIAGRVDDTILAGCSQCRTVIKVEQARLGPEQARGTGCPCSLRMLATVVRQVAGLAERTQVGRGAVLGLVV